MLACSFTHTLALIGLGCGCTLTWRLRLRWALSTFDLHFCICLHSWYQRWAREPLAMASASSIVSLELPARQLCFRWFSDQKQPLIMPLIQQAASPGRDNGALGGEDRGPSQGQTKKPRIEWNLLDSGLLLWIKHLQENLAEKKRCPSLMIPNYPGVSAILQL